MRTIQSPRDRNIGVDRHRLTNLLEEVRRGERPVEEAVALLRTAPIMDLGFANVDQHRHLRCGFPEVIFSEGKTPDQTLAIFETISQSSGGCLATRVSAEQAQALIKRFPDCEYDPVARTIWRGAICTPMAGAVAILTAGTSDLPVAREALVTAKVMGCDVRLITDVGVAGLHRLLSRQEEFVHADCVVVVAGMEGALASVVGGLIDCPVIAVPTSIGYGANLAGVTTMMGMMTSCAANVAVVNIDAGFCGAYVASLIARRAALRSAKGSWESVEK